MEAETFPSAWCFCFDERDVIDDAVGKRKWLESPLVTLLASPAYSVRVESEANLRRRREPRGWSTTTQQMRLGFA